MPHLIVVRDVLRGGRAVHELTLGASLGKELMRLEPEGFGGAWQIYRDAVVEQCELAAADLPGVTVEDTDYIIVVRPAGPTIIAAFKAIEWMQMFWAFLVSTAIGAIVYLMTPKPRKPTGDENKDSPNNRIAGQSNQLRAGARVPDLLGKVRAYPDLLLPPLEVWTKRRQEITQFFVIGVGEYLVEESKLGETPISGMSGVSPPTIYPPGSTDVPAMRCIRVSPEVNQLGLVTQNETGIEVTGGTFTAPNQLSLPVYHPMQVGDVVDIRGTLSNNGIFGVSGGPAEDQVTPPFLYGLYMTPVVNEALANPIISILPLVHSFMVEQVFPGIGPPDAGWFHNAFWAPAIGNFVEIDTTVGGGTEVWRGYVTSSEALVILGQYHVIIEMTDLDGDPITFIDAGATALFPFREWDADVEEPPEPEPGADENEWSDWYTVPMQNPDEIWIDVAFPQGLAQYFQGDRRSLEVEVRAEFRRLGGTDAEDSIDYTYEQSTTGPMRWTHKVQVENLTTLDPSPPASPYIQVRLWRITPFRPDDDEHQYFQETVWERLAAIHILPSRVYPSVTLAGLGLVNTRSAASIGENSFNCVCTRILPHWNGTDWDDAAPTEKWADNIVARIKADDGANKTDEEIDLAGIYAIQDELDMGPDGEDGGKISLTIDQEEDIDNELQTIAQLVRGTLYRIGRKLYITRDQGGKTPLALFTGRSKHPDGEQVNLTVKNDSEYDAVVVQWFDRDNGWKLREYQFPEGTPLNEFRISPPHATWAQAWRRGQFEWNRIQLRREAINLQATEEGRLVHIGDVINVTDDVANLAQSAGELIEVAGTTLTLDKPIDISAGGFTILLRAQNGRDVEEVAVTAGVDTKHVVLAGLPAFDIKGRDDTLGTMYAIYEVATAVVRPWLVTSMEPAKSYVRLVGTNWREDVYAGDTDTLPDQPELTLRVRRVNGRITSR